MPTFAMRLAHRTVAPALRWWLRLEVEGRGLVPGTGGVLLAANHRSFLDHFVVGAASPRPVWFLGKAELARGPGGRLNQALGMVPIERGTGDLGTMRSLAELLRMGEVVAMFPEGTRSPDGALYRFRSGLARLAAAAQAPIVPIGLVGTAEVWPRHRQPRLRRPEPWTLMVHFGTLVPPPLETPKARRACTATVQHAVSRLSQQPLSDRFAPIPALRER